jgi:hypothetical protein
MMSETNGYLPPKRYERENPRVEVSIFDDDKAILLSNRPEIEERKLVY